MAIQNLDLHETTWVDTDAGKHCIACGETFDISRGGNCRCKSQAVDGPSAAPRVSHLPPEAGPSTAPLSSRYAVERMLENANEVASVRAEMRALGEVDDREAVDPKWREFDRVLLVDQTKNLENERKSIHALWTMMVHAEQEGNTERMEQLVRRLEAVERRSKAH